MWGFKSGLPTKPPGAPEHLTERAVCLRFSRHRFPTQVRTGVRKGGPFRQQRQLPAQDHELKVSPAVPVSATAGSVSAAMFTSPMGQAADSVLGYIWRRCLSLDLADSPCTLSGSACSHDGPSAIINGLVLGPASTSSKPDIPPRLSRRHVIIASAE